MSGNQLRAMACCWKLCQHSSTATAPVVFGRAEMPIQHVSGLGDLADFVASLRVAIGRGSVLDCVLNDAFHDCGSDVPPSERVDFVSDLLAPRTAVAVGMDLERVA
jgi:hypothetical protein